MSSSSTTTMYRSNSVSTASLSSSSTLVNSASSSTSQSKRAKRDSVQLPVQRPTYRLLFEDDYHDEVLEYMRDMNSRTLPSPSSIASQPELKPYMRPFLLDFLLEIHQSFRLRPEVLYLSINLVDRYVSKRVVHKRHYQLVGCTALWVAAKFEDSKDRVPVLLDLVTMCSNTYTESAFIQMESHLLSTLGWGLGHPTAEAWLRIIGSDQGESAETMNVARFVMEVGAFDESLMETMGEIVAGGAIILARWLLSKQAKVLLSASNPQVAYALALDNIMSAPTAKISQILITKYSHMFYSQASLFVVEEYQTKRRTFKDAIARPRPTLVRSNNLRFDHLSPINTVATGRRCFSSSSSITTTSSEGSNDDSMLRTPSTSCTDFGVWGPNSNTNKEYFGTPEIVVGGGDEGTNGVDENVRPLHGAGRRGDEDYDDDDEMVVMTSSTRYQQHQYNHQQRVVLKAVDANIMSTAINPVSGLPTPVSDVFPGTLSVAGGGSGAALTSKPTLKRRRLSA